MKFTLLLLLMLPLASFATTEADFRAAREAFRAGNAARLAQPAERLKSTVLEPYATYFGLGLDLDAKDTAPIKAFLARGDESPVVDQFRGEWLVHLAEQQRWDEFGEEYPHLVSADDELTCYGKQLQQRSDAESALREARKLWLNPNGLPESCTVLFRDALAAGFISEPDVWQRMRLALENGNTTLAKQLIHLLPPAHAFPAAELSMAASNPRSYLERTKFENASDGRRLAALFALQRLAKRSAQMAYVHWQKIAAYFSQAEQRYFFGWLGYEAAQEHDERALSWFAAAGDAVLNEQQLAWRTRAALRALDWHEVWSSINAMSPEQQGHPAWRYWKGRALQVLGRPAEARALFVDLSREYRFYGQLAAEELGALPGAAMVSGDYRPTDDEIEAIQAMPAVQRTVLLYRMDLRSEAAKEWAWATRNFSDRQLLAAAEVARRNDMYDRSINAADRTVELHDFNLRYPAPYRDVMQEDVRRHGLDESWVFGLMRQESRFAASAKSEVGAAGLMQIMPDTARWVARRMGMKGYRKGLIHQLDVNIKLGTYYMKTVSSQFDDNPVLASAAYNAGPSRAAQWRGKHAMEGAIYTETIPFPETRDYVRKVMSNTAFYAKLFGEPPRSLKERLGVIEGKNDSARSKVSSNAN